MAFEKDSVEKMQLNVYSDMIKNSLKNRGVIFILIIFVILCILSFAIGYSFGFNSVECQSCLLI